MSELVGVAILAFRCGRFRDAIELLLQVTEVEPNNWFANLYLGMSYEKTGRTADAYRLFKRISDECPDDHLRVKCEAALPILEAEMSRRFGKEPAASKKSETAFSQDVTCMG